MTELPQRRRRLHGRAKEEAKDAEHRRRLDVWRASFSRVVANKRARQAEIDVEMKDAQAVLGRCPLMMVVVAPGEHTAVSGLSAPKSPARHRGVSDTASSASVLAPLYARGLRIWVASFSISSSPVHPPSGGCVACGGVRSEEAAPVPSCCIAGERPCDRGSGCGAGGGRPSDRGSCCGVGARARGRQRSR